MRDFLAEIQAANDKSSATERLSRIFNVLRYYRTSQLLRRAVRQLRPDASRLSARMPDELDSLVVRQQSVELSRAVCATRSIRSTQSASQLLGDLSQGQVTLLSQQRDLGSPIDWQGRREPHPSRLWSFQLHYHEYLLDLAVGAAAEGVDPWPTIWKVVADWIDHNPIDSASVASDAWHPYCLSRRVPVWTQLLATGDPPTELRQAMIASLARQAETLSQRLEFDLGGNHLLENLTALAIAGAFFEGKTSERWLELATKLLRIELPRQVLPPGEHFERAPMYHCQVLGNLLQVTILTSGISPTLATLCRDYARRMLDFLEHVLHPDGEIPLFGDSCWGEVHSVADIKRLADLAGVDSGKRNDSRTNSVGRYWTWRQDNSALIFDTGAVGADELPAHAHCDLLGFEASIDGQRWFVDSGVFDYDDSDMRAYCRASAAHNVVTVGWESCCDVWSRFRMGRRARPTSYANGREDTFDWCEASHDGYRHLGIPAISRLLVAHESGDWVCFDYARAGSEHPLIGRLHLAPKVRVTNDSPDRIVLSVGDVQRWLSATADVMLEVSEGWYCQRFGSQMKTQVITYRLKDDAKPRSGTLANQVLGWSLTSTPDSLAISQSSTSVHCQFRSEPDGVTAEFSRQLFD